MAFLVDDFEIPGPREPYRPPQIRRSDPDHWRDDLERAVLATHMAVHRIETDLQRLAKPMVEIRWAMRFVFAAIGLKLLGIDASSLL